MKNGILLSGGMGTRLLPLTEIFNKQLISVNGKFIIDYSIDTLKQMGVENLTIILGGTHFDQVVDHVKDGQSFGLKVNYIFQNQAKGIAQAISLCERYVSDAEEFAIILGDNLFENKVVWDECDSSFAQILLKEVPDPKRFGVAFCDENGIQKIVEKPTELDPNYSCFAITGCYLFNQKFFQYFKNIVPSQRGEFEIVDIIKAYHKDGLLKYSLYNDFWSDAGTHQSIAYCNNYFYNKGCAVK